MKEKDESSRKNSPPAKVTQNTGQAASAPAPARFQAVFECSRDAIGVLKAGLHLFVNPAYLEIFGFPPGTDLAGKPVLDLIAPGDRDEIKAMIARRAPGDSAPAAYATRGLRVDGSQIAMAVHVSGYQEDGAELTLVILRDISEHEQAVSALKQSETRFRRLYNETPILLHSIDRDGVVVEVNDHWLKTMGFERDEVLGRKVTDFYAAASRTFARETVHPAFFRDGVANEVAYQFVRKTGEILDVLLSATAERDTDGTILRSQAVIVDVTARKRAEDLLRRSEARYRMLYQGTPVMMHSIDATGRLVSVSDRWLEQLGYARDEVLGRPSTDFLDEQSRTYARTVILPDFMRTGVCTDVPYTFVKKNGESIATLLSATAERDEDGKVVRSLAVIIDITDQRLLEQERVKTQKLESVGTLAGGIAHDFNNLLQGVFGFISMARLTHDQKEKSLAMLEQAERALQQSVNLTSQLLTFSKGGQPVLKLVALRPLIENAVALALSGSRNSAGIVVEPELCAVEADDGQLGQVIQNIVLNADQAMPLGGVIRVAVRNVPAASLVPPADLRGDLVEIEINDQGTGIPPEHLARIFDPYFTTKEKGSGLGLASSYSIVRNHGGLLRVQSQVGRGTTFRIFLPAAVAKLDEIHRSALPAAATRTGRILVMDDEEMIRELAGEMLLSLGHEVVTAGKGESALEAFRAARQAGRPFDLVILDLTIRGGMGGIETARRLAEIDPEVKAVVSSGYSEDAARSSYREQGFRAILNKPYSVAELQGVVNTLLM